MHPTITTELMRQRTEERVARAHLARRSPRPQRARRRRPAMAWLRAAVRHA